MNAALGSTGEDEWGRVPIKLYLQKQTVGSDVARGLWFADPWPRPLGTLRAS